MPSERCPLCSGKTSPGPARFNYHACPSCEAWIRLPLPKPSEIAAIYDKQYYDSWGENENTAYPPYWKLKHELYRKLLNFAGSINEHGRALDIGCATGAGLSLLSDLGMDAHGIDVNPYAVEVATRLVPKAKVMLGRIEESALEENSYDLIFLSDVIEHTLDPRQFLKACWNLLKPGGKILILTPDISSLSIKVFGKHWPHIKEEHLFLFSRNGLEKLVQACGFSAAQSKHLAKPVSLDYAAHQLEIYKVPLISPVIKIFHKILPSSILHHFFEIPMGEIMVRAERPFSANKIH